MIQGANIQRRLFLIGASALTLSACGGGNLIGPPDAGTLYVVQPKFPPAPAGAAKVDWALAVMRPDMPGGLDTDRIALMQADGSMDYYAKATYPDRLPAIIQQAVLDGFDASGRIDSATPEQAALHADYNLFVEVKDFAAHYSQPDGIPGVTVSITAKMTTAHGRVVVASLPVVQTGTASANSAGATVQALGQALETAVTQIVTWALTMPKPVTQQPLTTASPGKPAEQLLKDAVRGSNKLREKVPAQ
jgi:cholesterol transport system auxiliary component